MKIKFPKKIKISSYTFRVLHGKKYDGGAFSFTEGTISIDTTFLKDDSDYVFMIICHEIMEVCASITKTRYNDNSVKENYKFFMDHKEFENNIKLFSSAIQKFIA